MIALRIIQTGIHTLVDFPSQDQAAIQAGLVEWSTFVIGGDKSGGDGKEGAITIRDNQNVPTRRWILFEDSAEFYSINLYDGQPTSNSSSLSMLTHSRYLGFLSEIRKYNSRC
jgi:hypothetical protein